jgi:hypothetical protein
MPPTGGLPELHPASYWANLMKPSLITLWGGANDVLGVISAPPGAMVVAGAADGCNRGSYTNPGGKVQPVAQNLTTSGFDVQFNTLIGAISDHYSATGEKMPDMIIGTVPPVTATATLFDLSAFEFGSAYSPYIGLNAKKDMRVVFHDADLTPTIQGATFALQPGVLPGKVSLLSQIREIGDRSLRPWHMIFHITSSLTNSAKLIFGSSSAPHALSQDEVLSNDVINGPSGLQSYIIGYNKQIIMGILSNGAPAWQQAVKEGRIHIFDAYRLLSLLSAPATPASYLNDPNSAWSLVNGVTGVPENMKQALLVSLADDEKAVEDTAREITALGIDNSFMGGLFGMDGVHPTNTGYGGIANCMLRILKSAAERNGDYGGMAGVRIRVADLYDLNYMRGRDPLRKLH